MKIWNITSEVPGREARSPVEIFPVLLQHFGKKPIRFLEIGVFQAGLFKRLMRSGLIVEKYVGIDPYLGTINDPYRGAYWCETEEATKVYESSRSMIESAGHCLRRQTSDEFFEVNREKWDVIYVDGDHRFLPAWRDIDEALRVCSDESLVMVDDYANATCPEVTSAFNEFYRHNVHNIQRLGYCHSWITPAGCCAPIVQSTVYFEPVAEDKRKFGERIRIPEALANTRTSLLDVSPRQAARYLGRRIGRGLVR